MTVAKRDIRRFLTGAQRRQVLVAANYRCEICGCELTREWEAHHVKAWSDGGGTNLRNMQALCLPCHKEAHMGPKYGWARNWQIEALETERRLREVSTKKTFVADIVTGAGKSRLAGMIGADWLAEGLCTHLIYITPLTSTIPHIADELYKFFGLQCRTNFFAGDPKLYIRKAPSVDVTIMTPPGLANPRCIELLDAWIVHEGCKPGLIIDEIHHHGKVCTWGEVIADFAHRATRCLLMSGTLFRNDNIRIEGVEYNSKHQTLADFEYLLIRALAEGVLRPTSIHYHDPHVTLMTDAGKESHSLVSSLSQSAWKSCRDALYVQNSQAMHQIIRGVHNDLCNFRGSKFPKSKGLFVCAGGHFESDGHTSRDSLRKIKRFAKVIKEITSREVLVVTCDDPDREGKLERFRSDDSVWYLLTIGMAAEGFNCPQVRVIGLLRPIDSRGLFQQIIGRGMRTVTGEDNSIAQAVHMIKAGLQRKFADEIGLQVKEYESIKDKQLCAGGCGKHYTKCSCPCIQCGLSKARCICSRCPKCKRKERWCNCDKHEDITVVENFVHPGGGSILSEDVDYCWIERAVNVRDANIQFTGMESVQLGNFLEKAFKGGPFSKSESTSSTIATGSNVRQERTRLRREINGWVNKIAARFCDGDYQRTWMDHVHPLLEIRSIKQLDDMRLEQVKECRDLVIELYKDMQKGQTNES